MLEVPGHGAIPGLLCSLQQVTLQKSGLYSPGTFQRHIQNTLNLLIAKVLSDLRLVSGKGLQASHKQGMLLVTPRVLNQ